MAFQLNRLSAVVAAGFIALAIAPVHAEAKKGVNVSKKAAAMSDSAAAVDAIRTANQLARYGYTNKDPLALITAAKIKKEAGGSDSKAERVGGKAADAKNKPDTLAVEEIGRAHV